MASAVTTPLRVVIVAPSLEILGGQSVQAARLLALLGREPSLDVSFLPHNPRMPGALKKLQSIKYLRTVVTTLLYIATLLVRLRKYDVIHIFSASYWSFLMSPAPAIVIGRLYGKKVLLNYHSGEAEDHLQKWRSAVPIIKFATKVIVPSKYLVDVLGRFGVQAEAVFNTIDLAHFTFRERRKLQPVLVSNRNFEPLYNVECVLRAFAVIQQEVPQAKLIVAGDGSRRDNLHGLRAELKLRNVDFVGRVAPEDMPSLCDQADVYVNATNIDNMPLSIIEAFACGLPVVTTDAGGIPYILKHGHTGIMVRCDDHEALARGVLQVLEDQELAGRLVRAARIDVEQYAWTNVRREWLRVYRELTIR